MQPPISEPLLLRVDEVAALTGLKVRAVYRAAAEGRIPGVRRLGRALYFSKPELLHWLGAIGPREAAR